MEPLAVKQLQAILRRLNPEATILTAEHARIAPAQILATRLFDEKKTAAAAPARLNEALDEGWENVLRAKGMMWIASKHDIIGHYAQAGNCVGVEPVRRWYAASPREEWPEDAATLDALAKDWHPEFGDRMQEVVFIGAGMERSAIAAALDACLLTDRELAEGPEAWAH